MNKRKIITIIAYLAVVMKKTFNMNSQLNEKIYENSINYVCVYHHYYTIIAGYWMSILIITTLRKAHDVEYCQ